MSSRFTQLLILLIVVGVAFWLTSLSVDLNVAYRKPLEVLVVKNASGEVSAAVDGNGIGLDWTAEYVFERISRHANLSAHLIIRREMPIGDLFSGAVDWLKRCGVRAFWFDTDGKAIPVSFGVVTSIHEGESAVSVGVASFDELQDNPVVGANEVVVSVSPDESVDALRSLLLRLRSSGASSISVYIQGRSGK